MKRLKLTYLLFALMVLFSCSSGPVDPQVSDNLPAIYPDYVDVTIPVNIAPLNFLLRDSVEKTRAEIVGSEEKITVLGKQKIQIPEKKWRRLLVSGEQKIKVTVSTLKNGKWTQYKPFSWEVKADPIDGFLSYRLIEPGYEVWNRIQLVERHLESFDERVLAENNLTGGSCMNCHIYGNQDPQLSMFHLRGPNGGTVLNRNGELRKIDTRNDEMIANATYGNLHPSGRYGVFSSNVVIPELHTYGSERLEVYDRASDLIVIDFDENRVITQPFLSDSITFETFPVFAADGRSIYYCAAPASLVPDSIRSLRYSIHRIDFDPESTEIGTRVDTLWDAEFHGGSVSHLKTSPDGKYLLFTVADYGTFPIWHREAELQMMDLATGELDQLPEVNGPNSDTYHSWSSNSCWFVFASKRDNGIYGKPYFAYVDENGHTGKPFVLPQKDPATYDFMLKSFNIPELSRGSVPFDAMDIEKLYKNMEPEKVN